MTEMERTENEMLAAFEARVREGISKAQIQGGVMILDRHLIAQVCCSKDWDCLTTDEKAFCAGMMEDIKQELEAQGINIVQFRREPMTPHRYSMECQQFAAVTDVVDESNLVIVCLFATREEWEYWSHTADCSYEEYLERAEEVKRVTNEKGKPVVFVPFERISYEEWLVTNDLSPESAQEHSACRSQWAAWRFMEGVTVDHDQDHGTGESRTQVD
jgi:hypothetical protein